MEQIPEIPGVWEEVGRPTRLTNLMVDRPCSIICGLILMLLVAAVAAIGLDYVKQSETTNLTNIVVNDPATIVFNTLRAADEHFLLLNKD